jgi:hypothetical protein
MEDQMAAHLSGFELTHIVKEEQVDRCCGFEDLGIRHQRSGYLDLCGTVYHDSFFLDLHAALLRSPLTIAYLVLLPKLRTGYAGISKIVMILNLAGKLKKKPSGGERAWFLEEGSEPRNKLVFLAGEEPAG